MASVPDRVVATRDLRGADGGSTRRADGDQAHDLPGRTAAATGAARRRAAALLRAAAAVVPRPATTRQPGLQYPSCRATERNAGRERAPAEPERGRGASRNPAHDRGDAAGPTGPGD